MAALDVFGQGRPGTADIIAAINWCIANKATYNVVALNMSLGSGRYYSPVTSASGGAMWTAMNGARAVGITFAVASGNNAYLDSIAYPAAIDQAVSVGAVYDSSIGTYSSVTCTDTTTAADKVTCFSNSANFLTVLAPGAMITAAGITMPGTSQASPHVAGAAAVLRSAFPAETVEATIQRLTNGVPVTDARNGITTPRLDIKTAADLAYVAHMWTATGSMATQRDYHTVTLLPSGKVLVAGGYNGTYLASAEVYDPDTATWTETGAMGTARSVIANAAALGQGAGRRRIQRRLSCEC